jgi:cyclic-di-GMP phosphodiesterase TipF (flagellum assembly factor)
MPVLADLLFFVAYALISVIVGALTPFVLPAISPVLSVMMGGVTFLLFAQFHQALSQILSRKSLARAIHRLKEEQVELAQEVEAAKAAANQARTELDETMSGRNAEMVSQMKMIETLLRQVVTKSGPRHLPPAAEPEAHSDRSDTPEIEVASDEVYEIMRNALEENRVDLYLQPIVSLPQRRQQHYEAFTRVRDGAGHIIYPNQYLEVAHESGLITTLDNLLLFNCVKVIRQLKNRRPGTRFFCNIASAALKDRDFFPQFVDFVEHNIDLSNRLVFEFKQEDVADHGVALARDLKLLGRLGFQFSMDHVTDLKIDFAALAERHFDYIKIPAKTLLKAAGDIHPADLKLAMERHGIDLIVEKVEDERTVLQLLDFNVDYGQGYLFGEPRPARAASQVDLPDEDRSGNERFRSAS